MKKPVISIVVPIYNVELYLERCINSILVQTFEQFELILVDDGSTDKSLEICNILSKADERIIVLHKKNGGLSDARNFGRKHSKGKYITFIDSDDMIDKDFLKKLYENIQKYDADISIVSFNNIDENDLLLTHNECNKPELISKQEILIGMYSKDHNIDFVTAWGKLYKNEYFNYIEYPVGRLHEDEFTTYKLYLMSNKIVYEKFPGYLYRQRTGSIMTKSFSIKRLDILRAYKERLYYLKNEDKKCLLLTEYMYCLNLINCYKKVKINNEIPKNILIDIKNEIDVYFKPMYFMINKISILRVIRLIILRITMN